MASRMFSRGARAISTLRFRMNRSLSNVSRSSGSLTITRSAPSSSSAIGRMAFSRATDSGTNSTTDGGMTTSLQIDEVERMLLRHRPHDFFARGVAQRENRVEAVFCPTIWRAFWPRRPGRG